MGRFTAALLLLTGASPLITIAIAADEFGTVFKRHNANGTLVVERLSDGRRWVHNEGRSHGKYEPASTFKIPHTVIALHLGIEPDVDTVVPWDGKVRRIHKWNRSYSLRGAFRASSVPIYQNIARRIGIFRMRKAIEQLAYGNGQVGDVVDQFWLQGPLKVTAHDQIGFLKQLQKRALPFSITAQEQTIDIMALRTSKDEVLRGKTGWSISSWPGIGWFVGWRETPDDVLFFALNIDMTMKHHRQARRSILQDALKLIPTSSTK